MYRRCWTFLGVLVLAGLTTQISLQCLHAQNKTKEVYTDPSDPTMPPEFKIQGEYLGDSKGAKYGCQIIALGKGALQAVLLPGGLPGDGWDGKDKILMQGEVADTGAKFEPATGKRNYMARDPMQFSATAKFPPVGQKAFSAMVDANGVLSASSDSGESFQLKKITRKSDRLGAKAPSGAIVIFDGTDTKELDRGRIDPKTGFLNTDGNDLNTKRKFNDYTAHVEFMIAFRPNAREQQRGNSGFYQVLLYEVQILDSFGLEGKNNECGGIYNTKGGESKVNMCYPPLTWQTYDVDFTNGVREGDKLVKHPRITVRHNGVLIHDNFEIKGPTGGGRGGDKNAEGTPGPLQLQGHGNPTQFKNFWVVEKK